jgi:hypothetical protein
MTAAGDRSSRSRWRARRRRWDRRAGRRCPSRRLSVCACRPREQERSLECPPGEGAAYGWPCMVAVICGVSSATKPAHETVSSSRRTCP